MFVYLVANEITVQIRINEDAFATVIKLQMETSYLTVILSISDTTETVSEQRCWLQSVC